MAAEEDRETTTGEEGGEFLPLLRRGPEDATIHRPVASTPIYGSRSELLSNLDFRKGEKETTIIQKRWSPSKHFNTTFSGSMNLGTHKTINNLL
jgi:hypothetical protein